MIKTNKTNNWYESIIKFLCVISLFFSFTNYIFISAIATFTVFFILPLVIKNGWRINYLGLSILCFYLFSIISGLIIQPTQFLSFEFYRRDGNVFISFAPLLVLCICNIKFDVWKIIMSFVLIGTVANLAGILYHIIKRPAPEYFMWFSAHNAAGGFLAILCIATIFVILHYYKNGFAAIIFTACLVINLFGLYLTNSRGSILPFVIALVIFFLIKIVKNIDVWIFLIFFLVLFILEVYIMSVRGDDTIVVMDEYFVPKEFEEHPFFANLLSIFTRSSTVINRMFYLWCRAVYLFFKSPVFGIGFGGYNDIPYNLVGIENVIMVNASDTMISSSSHAHNTFFHVLAEQGMFGFALLLIMIFMMKKAILKEKDKKLKSMLLIMFFYAVGSSFFEHRFFTPAQMIPFLLIFGMAISNSNYDRKYTETYQKLY